jgi:hypothetical protein
MRREAKPSRSAVIVYPVYNNVLRVRSIPYGLRVLRTDYSVFSSKVKLSEHFAARSHDGSHDECDVNLAISLTS